MQPPFIVVPVRFALRVGLALASVFAADAAPPPGYYASADGKSGVELRQALHAIIDGHTYLPYSSSSFDTHDALRTLDRDPGNAHNVILVYSRRSEPTNTWPSWNREHLWPNSLGIDDAYPAYSDLHNMRASDANVNSSRGNEYFDWSDTNSASYVFPAHAEAPECSSDSDSWEPPDSVKGDIARSQFYMAVRYEGDAGEPDLELVQDTAVINSSAAYMGRLSTLIEWHQVDPVDAAEQLRNDGVYSYQSNRNPFVDHPEWVRAVFIPRLKIERSGLGMRLRWEDTGVSFSIESAASQAGPWAPVPGLPALTNGSWTLELVKEGQERLYRLRL